MLPSFKLATKHLRGAGGDVRAGNTSVALSRRGNLLGTRLRIGRRRGRVESFAAVGRVGEPALRRVAFIGFQPAGEVDAQLAQPAAQGLPRDPQPAGGLLLIA